MPQIKFPLNTRSTFRLLLALWIGFQSCVVVCSQQPFPAPSQKQEPRDQEEDVVRITTNLVQVDAVITDKSGKPVTDLKPEEVQILEDNRSQKITHFSYVAANPVSATPATKIDSRTPTAPTARLRQQDVRRAIAIVVDDLGLSYQSIYFVRRALKKFVAEQMQPGDLVAIIRTSGGIGALQQFTADRRQLSAAIDAVKYYAGGRAGIGAFAPIEPPTPGKFGAVIDQKMSELDEMRDDMFAVGTLGAISYVIRGLSDLPGRKSVLLISDGFKLETAEFPNRTTDFGRSGGNDRTLQRLERLVDQASRASVVVHTLNPTGLQTLSSFSAEDSLADSKSLSGAITPEKAIEHMSNRRDSALDLQTGLNFLADKTGGMAIRNTNDVTGALKRVMDDQGYYLIGYRPDQSTFNPRTGQRTFHHLSLKVNRPGSFVVRMRNGFLGVTEGETRPSAASAREQILRALISPFGAAAVPVRLTSLFANDPKQGSYMRSLLHVDGSALTFTDEPDGWHQAQFDVVAVTFGENGNIVDEVGRVDQLRVKGEAYERVLKAGFVYMLTVPIKKPGAYQLRVALRDQASGKLGSSSQFVAVPDLKKSRLELSGIMLGTHPNDQSKASQPVDPARNAAVRQFHAGDNLSYGFVIYNARLDKNTSQPQLQTQVRLFRNGEPVFTGRLQPFSLNNPTDLGRLAAESSIQLGREMVPGEYVLQVVATDLLADEKHRTATQWIDFEIVK